LARALLADDIARSEPEGRRARDPLDGYLVEDQVGFLMRRAHQRHAALFLERMAPLDLTPTQFTALIKIAELGRVTQNQLGRLVATDPATIQGVVRRLVARALVRRATDPMDRRTAVLAPTQAGLELAATAVVLAREITEATLEPLEAAERPRLLALLQKLC
jgi:MarR family transcriptional regulator, lower aerobic nicotinate degradation pathway regulator